MHRGSDRSGDPSGPAGGRGGGDGRFARGPSRWSGGGGGSPNHRSSSRDGGGGRFHPYRGPSEYAVGGGGTGGYRGGGGDFGETDGGQRSRYGGGGGGGGGGRGDYSGWSEILARRLVGDSRYCCAVSRFGTVVCVPTTKGIGILDLCGIGDDVDFE
jgi:hypothetical protein